MDEKKETNKKKLTPEQKQQEQEKLVAQLKKGQLPKGVKIYKIGGPIKTKNVLIYLVIAYFMISALVSLGRGGLAGEEIALSRALSDINNQLVKRVEVSREELKLEYKPVKGQDQVTKVTRMEEGDTFTELLDRFDINTAGLVIENKNLSFSDLVTGFFINLLPLLLGIGLLFYFFRQARGAQDGIFSFGKSKAKLFYKGKQSVRFKDVAGVQEAKEELEEVVDFLKNPAKYKKLGARTPKGVILIGPAGVGKTLLAKAVAGEAKVAFYSIAGSEFMEMLVGVGASRVRDLFATAKKQKAAIIFIDEIDAIGRQRGSGFAGGHDEREQTLNQILVEMDGFTGNDNVMVLAATNRGDMLDPALLRPGRFDRRVVLDMPDIEDRKQIIEVHKRGKPFAKNINWDMVARRTVQFSGADLENMLNEAAIRAARLGKTNIEFTDIEDAATKVKMGTERKTTQSEEDKLMTAYHEGGHAVVSHFTPKSDPVHRISIVSRGMALGYTMIPPKADKYTQTRTELLARVRMMLGGRAAEELVYDEFTSGAASDIDRATALVRQMVVELGMSRLGPVKLSPQYDLGTNGMMYGEPTKISDEMRRKVDDEIRRIIDIEYAKAKDLLTKHREKLDKLAKQLVRVETMEADEFRKIMK